MPILINNEQLSEGIPYSNICLCKIYVPNALQNIILIFSKYIQKYKKSVLMRLNFLISDMLEPFEEMKSFMLLGKLHFLFECPFTKSKQN